MRSRAPPCPLWGSRLILFCLAFLLLPDNVILRGSSTLPAQLSLPQRKELVSHFLAQFAHRLPLDAVAQLRATLEAEPASTGLTTAADDLAKDRLLHEWAIHNVTCKRVKTCMSLDPFVCADVCQDGSIEPDAWTSYALATQRRLQYDRPLNRVSLPGTHNSAITLADGYGLSEGALNELFKLVNPDWQVYIANQQLGLWDQFKLGVRHFELDIHWWSGDMRVCHAGGIHLQYLNDFIHFLSAELGIVIEWDSETIGCFSPFDRTLNDTFAEIRQFVFAPGNERDFVIFYFDDEEDLLSWSKVTLVLQGVAHHFGDAVFTPADKQRLFPNSWPSARQLNAAGKRLMFVSRTDYGAVMSDVLFARANLWREFGPFPFEPFPNCTVRNTPLRDGGTARVLGDSLAYGPFYRGYVDQMMMPEDLLQEARCAVNFACVDQLSPRLAEGFVWSWDKHQPSISGGCTALQPNGRWATLDCSTPLRSACIDPVTRTFALSSTATAWGVGVACPAGAGNLAFGVPANGYENAQLHQAARASSSSSPVWVNLRATTQQ